MSTLARLLPDLTKSQIENSNKRHNSRFTPKYRVFCIFQNKIDEFLRKSTKLWKIIYKKIDNVFDKEYKAKASAKRKEIREIGRKEEKKGEEKKVEEEKKDEEEKKEENKDEEENKEEKEEEKASDEQQEKSVQDTQLPPPSPPHATITPIETIKIKDVIDTSCQNINP